MLPVCIIAHISSLYASNLVNPLAPIPGARIGIGVSYGLGGHTITNREIPCLLNRMQVRLNYSPIVYANIGVDVGLAQMDVASDTLGVSITGLFHGKFKFSYGANLKLSSPLFRDIIGVIGIGQGTYFSSEDENGALYSGYDGAGAIGILFHIKNIGYAAVGSKLYLIKGTNKSYNSDVEQNYSNINNLRGWVAFDYFPRMKKISKQIPYFTLEVSVAPGASFGKRAPVQELSFSFSLGIITKRLYKKTSSLDWHP